MRLGLPPRGQWAYNQSGHFILADWTGTTAARTLYGYDGMPVDVVVLEEARGPGATEPFPFNPRLETPRAYYVVTAGKRALHPGEVPPGLRVRVDGFLRPGGWAISVYNPARDSYDIARREPRPGPSQGRPMDTFPLIKTRSVYEVRPDGTERLLWETEVPFDML